MKLQTIIGGVLLLAVPAQAAAGQSDRVAIGAFQGPQADRIQGAVETGLMTRYYVVPDFNVAAEARRQGVLLRDDDDFGTVGRALDVQAFVSAEVQKRAGWRVQLTVRRGDTGTAIGRLVLAKRPLDRLESQLATGASARVRSLLAKAARAGDPGAQATQPAPVEEVASAPEPEAEAPGPALIELSAGARIFSRSFSYAQNLSDLPAYDLGRAVASSFELIVRPGQLLSMPEGLRPLRLAGAFEYGLGIQSHVAGSEASRSTRVVGYLAGLGYELGRPGLVVAPQLAYASHTFSTGAEASSAAPDVRYGLLSAGADGRWAPAPGFALLAHAAYLKALSIAGLTAPERFPHATAQGLELETSVAFVFLPSVELRASLGLRRMAFSMHSQPGDRWVAGGAVDQTTWGGLSVAYRR
jgi:hypothetical protein